MEWINWITYLYRWTLQFHALVSNHDISILRYSSCNVVIYACVMSILLCDGKDDIMYIYIHILHRQVFVQVLTQIFSTYKLVKFW